MENVIRAHLGMKHSLVGVKILDRGSARKDKKPKKGMRFCEMVRKAADGNIFMAEVDDFSCPNAVITLGYEEPTYIDLQPRIMPSKTKVVEVGPVKAVASPDIILAILNPRQAMEIASMLDGVVAEFKGGLAVCGEGVALPYMKKRPNVTFLCGGARMFADYKDSEVIFSAPPEFFDKIAERIERFSKTCSALCGCRTSDIPPRVIETFKKLGFEKGTDYFFGKVGEHNVRIYLNKDFSGRIKYITIHLPVKGEVSVEKPLKTKKRGKWTDIAVTLTAGETADINTGKGLKEAIEDIIKKVNK